MNSESGGVEGIFLIHRDRFESQTRILDANAGLIGAQKAGENIENFSQIHDRDRQVRPSRLRLPNQIFYDLSSGSVAEEPNECICVKDVLFHKTSSNLASSL